MDDQDPALADLEVFNAENFPMMSEEAFERFLDQVEQGPPVVIQTPGKPPVVMMSIALWERIKP